MSHPSFFIYFVNISESVFESDRIGQVADSVNEFPHSKLLYYFLSECFRTELIWPSQPGLDPFLQHCLEWLLQIQSTSVFDSTMLEDLWDLGGNLIVVNNLQIWLWDKFVSGIHFVPLLKFSRRLKSCFAL